MSPTIRRIALLCSFTLALAVLSTLVQAQTFTVLHNFTGGADGKTPYTGLTIDRSGNLYGTTFFGGFMGNDCNDVGGPGGCGVIFRLAHHGSGWVLTSLYQFRGYPSGDGANPFGRVIVGPDGALYGTTEYGGHDPRNCYGNSGELGCGTVFKLTPPPTFCSSVSCPWIETQLYVFSATDGGYAAGEIAFDVNRNLYGATVSGGATEGGTAYKLTPAGELTTLYSFCSELNCDDGVDPTNGVQLDPSGNVYGTTGGGGLGGSGIAFQLAPSGSGWTLNTLYNFSGLGTGQLALTGLILDAAGNLYGGTSDGSPNPFVFELSPSNGSYILNTLYSFPYPSCCGVGANLVMDSAGNLYGTTKGDITDQVYGTVFKLTPSNGAWVYTDLHDFTGGSDGGIPYSSVVLDASGNLYGTASIGGANGDGVVWEITP